LSPEDAHSFKLDQLFDIFRANSNGGSATGIDLLNVGPYAAPKWLALRGDLDKLLGPVETHASTLLKNRLYALADKPELLMQEFTSFGALLRRPSVARALENERKTLLSQLATRLEELKQNFEQYSADIGGGSSAAGGGGRQPPAIKNQPSVFLARIIWAHQLSHRLAQILSIVTSVLAGIAGAERFHSLAAELRRRIDKYAQGLFEQWHAGVKAALEEGGNSPLRLETSGKLMELDTGSKSGSSTGALVIHYSEALVTLLREVRQLQEYGYKISDSVLSPWSPGQ